ncbi:unnamed protein product [Bursaphelenchus xylophilus]|uniref:(pine wood nematode) hypothetical protein n=1 Tax=Bursaphelenchus xylophilus TaxID=6326 RepID=A0A811M1N9_BURXY|nr:unnamed protein product [Bursaphelenchus xylophilus]CAG9130482.1 unnamed protein product [Bursaphelenchus xylophilus]
MEPQIPDLILLSTPDGLTATRPDSPTETSHPGAHSAEHGCWMEEQAALVSPGTSTSSIRPPSSSIQQSVPFSTFDEKQGSLSLLDSSMNLGVMNRRKSTFVSLDSHTPMMSRKRSMRSCMSELEALAAQRRRQVPIIPKHTRSARIDLMAGEIFAPCVLSCVAPYVSFNKPRTF